MLGEDDLGRAGGSSSSSRAARGDSQDSDPDWGVIPRSVHALFQELNSRSASAAAASSRKSRRSTKQGRSNDDEEGNSDEENSVGGDDGEETGSFHYSVHCSMLQIYNEQLHDLLSPAALNGEGEALHIRETPGSNANGNGGKGGTQGELFVSGLSSYRVEAVEDVLALLRFGAQARAVRATEYNEVRRLLKRRRKISLIENRMKGIYMHTTLGSTGQIKKKCAKFGASFLPRPLFFPCMVF